MATVNFHLSQRGGAIKREILLRFSWGNGNALRAKSGVFVYAEYWSDKKQAFKTTPLTPPAVQKDCKVQLKRLSDLKGAIIIASTEQNGFTKDWLTNIIDRTNNPSKYTPQAGNDFFTAFERFQLAHKIADARKRNFWVLFRALKRFEVYSKNPLNLDLLNGETLAAFEDFLRKEHTFFTRDEETGRYTCLPKYADLYAQFPETRTPQPRGTNTINDLLGKFRTFCKWATKQGLTTNTPFAGYKVEECNYSTPIYLSLEERRTLEKTDLSSFPALAIQRDIFIFQSLIGCRVSDLYALTRKNIVRGAVEYIAEKTVKENPNVIRVPLTPTATAILERYKDFPGPALFPFFSQQKYNVAIKKACRLAGLDRVVTWLNPTTGKAEQRFLWEVVSSHTARKNFVGNLYRQVRDPALIAPLSGHKPVSKAFARYRAIDEDMKAETVKLLD